MSKQIIKGQSTFGPRQNYDRPVPSMAAEVSLCKIKEIEFYYLVPACDSIGEVGTKQTLVYHLFSIKSILLYELVDLQACFGNRYIAATIVLF